MITMVRPEIEGFPSRNATLRYQIRSIGELKKHPMPRTINESLRWRLWDDNKNIKIPPVLNNLAMIKLLLRRTLPGDKLEVIPLEEPVSPTACGGPSIRAMPPSRVKYC